MATIVMHDYIVKGVNETLEKMRTEKQAEKMDIRLLEICDYLYAESMPVQYDRFSGYSLGKKEPAYNWADLLAVANGKFPPTLAKFKEQAIRRMELDQDPEYHDYLRLKAKYEN